MAFTPNDYCTVTLTEAGAAMLNAKGTALNEAFKNGPHWRTDWKAGDDYRATFWCMCSDFEHSFRAGAAMAFSDLCLEPESPAGAK